MAANKSVIVLAPNGRRHTVKVTPNTTILQILEVVCEKHEYNVDEYDARHFKKILDPNAILRFTGLANNAQLEMVPCTKARAVSNVTIGIQLESGERLTGEFTPDATLAEVLHRVCPDKNLVKAVLIYMHREIYGMDIFEKTTLKSLGLNSGRAILRLIFRDPEQLKTQAHVSAPLTPKLPKESSPVTASTSTACESESSTKLFPKTIVDPLSLLQSERAKVIGLKSTDNTKAQQKVKVEGNKLEEGHLNDQASSLTDKGSEVSREQQKEESLQGNDDAVARNIQFLGDRYALVFNQAGVEALPREELPDNFFEVTLDDAKVLLRDAKRRREELEDAPLLTDAQRQLNHEKRTLNQLHKYRRTIIRIQFPDQFVLQGLFGPLETVEKIKDFIKIYLVDSGSDFEIYTTPPKHILDPDTRLIDENLVPSAIVHYSGSSNLKPEIKDMQTDPRDAGIQTIKVRMQMMRQEDEDGSSTEATATTDSSNASVACTSASYSKNQKNTKMV